MLTVRLSPLGPEVLGTEGLTVLSNVEWTALSDSRMGRRAALITGTPTLAVLIITPLMLVAEQCSD